MAYDKIKLTFDGAIAIVALNDPATLNAASDALTGELTDAFDRLAAGEFPVRCVILTGEGRAFCSGASLAGSGTPGATDRLGTIFNPFLSKLSRLPIPIVTAFRGAAAGVGSSIALMGDLIVCGESAYFLQAFRRIGLVPDGGATWMLPRTLGKARAMELALLGERLPAARALEWGLINKVVPDDAVMAAAMVYARLLATGPASLGMMRQLIWQGLTNGHDDQLEAERQAQLKAAKTADAAEGVAAFREKRPAAFTGK